MNKAQRLLVLLWASEAEGNLRPQPSLHFKLPTERIRFFWEALTQRYFYNPGISKTVNMKLYSLCTFSRGQFPHSPTLRGLPGSSAFLQDCVYLCTGHSRGLHRAQRTFDLLPTNSHYLFPRDLPFSMLSKCELSVCLKTRAAGPTVWVSRSILNWEMWVWLHVLGHWWQLLDRHWPETPSERFFLQRLRWNTPNGALQRKGWLC